MQCDCAREGDEHGWHFDGNDFVVSLLLQAPENGGAFEFAPYIRDEGKENYAAVAAAMDGVPGSVRQKTVRPGTLMIFCGRRALHRVTPRLRAYTSPHCAFQL